jgi:hypothetical protein
MFSVTFRHTKLNRNIFYHLQAREIESHDAEGIVTPKLSGMLGRANFYWMAASDMLDRKDRQV